MQLICVFVFAYAKSRVSHDEAHLKCTLIKTDVFVAVSVRLYLCLHDLLRIVLSLNEISEIYGPYDIHFH